MTSQTTEEIIRVNFPFFLFKALIPIMFALLIGQGISETIKNIAFLRGVVGSGSVHDSPETPTPDDAAAERGAA